MPGLSRPALVPFSQSTGVWYKYTVKFKSLQPDFYEVIKSGEDRLKTNGFIQGLNTVAYEARYCKSEKFERKEVFFPNANNCI